MRDTCPNCQNWILEKEKKSYLFPKLEQHKGYSKSFFIKIVFNTFVRNEQFIFKFVTLYVSKRVLFFSWDLCDHAGFGIWDVRSHAHASAQPKTLETCKKACLVWFKKFQGMRQIARLKQLIYLSLSIKHKGLMGNLCVFIFCDRKIQW